MYEQMKWRRGLKNVPVDETSTQIVEGQQTYTQSARTSTVGNTCQTDR